MGRSTRPATDYRLPSEVTTGRNVEATTLVGVGLPTFLFEPVAGSRSPVAVAAKSFPYTPHRAGCGSAQARSRR